MLIESIIIGLIMVLSLWRVTESQILFYEMKVASDFIHEKVRDEIYKILNHGVDYDLLNEMISDLDKEVL